MRHQYLLLSDKLRLVSLLAFFYAYSSPVRVAARSILEGRQFQWGYPSGITPSGKVAMAWGHGLAGHADYILYLACAISFFLCMALRAPGRLVDAAIVAWTSIGLGVGLWLSNELGSRLVSEKATLGWIGMSYLWTEVLPVAIAWVLALMVLIRDLRRHEPPRPPRWTSPNNVLTLVAVAFLVVAAILFNLGPQHGIGDIGGIVTLYIGLLVLFVGLSPWNVSSTSSDSSKNLG